jgi:hypothetical protein
VQFARLAAYKAEHGDCNVPGSWAEDPKLAKWVHSFDQPPHFRTTRTNNDNN